MCKPEYQAEPSQVDVSYTPLQTTDDIAFIFDCDGDPLDALGSAVHTDPLTSYLLETG
jgi:hypothetical protein